MDFSAFLGSVSGSVSLAAIFLVGLLGGVHCLGMCGPLVTLYADRMPDEGEAITFYQIRQHGLFNLGRTTSYALIGAVLGGLGSLAFEVAGLAAVGDYVRAVVGLGVGTAVLVVGVGYVRGGSAGAEVAALPVVGNAFQRVYGAITSHVDDYVQGPGIFGMGMVHGVLPCPILYPAYLYAFSTGSALVGGVSLAVLGLGTFPSLFLYGTAIGTPEPETRERLHRVLGVGFLLLGTIPVIQALSVLGVPIPKPPLPMPMFPD